MVCLKSADKSDEEIIKSFSKTKWPYLHGKEKRTLWLNGLHSLLQTFSTIWTYGYGASNW
jgi:hypothetical protein